MIMYLKYEVNINIILREGERSCRDSRPKLVPADCFCENIDRGKGGGDQSLSSGVSQLGPA
jgi:hypothetical protein